MKTHENAEVEENQMDFCWGVPHENLHNCYSTTVINATPQQAFVAGFREGVKMSLTEANQLHQPISKHMACKFKNFKHLDDCGCRC